MNPYLLMVIGLLFGLAAILISIEQGRHAKAKLHTQICKALGCGWKTEQVVRSKLAESGLILGYDEFHSMMDELQDDGSIESTNCGPCEKGMRRPPRKFRVPIQPIRI
jgi:hypothetical protein